MYKYVLKDKTTPTNWSFLACLLDIHAIRRTYAQQLYRHLSGRELPPSEGRLIPNDYDRVAVIQISQALGHGERRINTQQPYSQ